MSPLPMDDAAAIRDRGWRQGSALLPDALPEDCPFEPAIPETAPDDAIFIVLTQDCDLVQSDFGKEPFVELIRALPVGAADGNLLYGKNPRRLHFAIGEATFEAGCHERTRIPRQLLAGFNPSPAHTLDPRTLDLLREWVAKRYIRPAFPDAFNDRIRQGNGRAIRKLLEREGYLFRDLYLMCDPSDEELGSEKAYRITVWPTMATEDYADEDRRNNAVVACSQFEALLDRCSGIELTECEVRHEGQITLDDLRYVAMWDFEYLSHREDFAPRTHP